MPLLETLIAAAAAAGCTLPLARSRRAGLALRRQHGLLEGRPVQLHTLTNARGMEVSLSELGAMITSVRVPDIHGRLGEVTLGLRTFDDYAAGHPCLGSTVGRYANRLAAGQLTIDGRTFSLARNNHGQHLHGGLRGFDKRVWSSAAHRTEDASVVRFTYVSPDGEEGYPGTLSVTVTYTLPDEADELRIDFAATTDAATTCNLTNHVFLNLAGEGNVLDHRLTLRADRLVPVDPVLIPTGELMEVAGTPFDFRRPHAIGERIGEPHEQLRRGRGYDHCYDLGTDQTLKSAAFVSEPTSGRTLEVLTDAPGLQFYTGNFLDGTKQGRWARPFSFRQGFCLEPGLFPDSPNQPGFHRLGYPSGILRPGERYAQQLVFRFGVVGG
jgi:aldose 1-epimerase